jgi:NAD(P)-dependent dehydrogenase (short-subunit alcohol dehydrogenase family)
MLMAVSLAEKLGKRNLLAYSVHPGVVLTSNLSGHLDLSAGLDNSDDYISCGKTYCTTPDLTHSPSELLRKREI